MTSIGRPLPVAATASWPTANFHAATLTLASLARARWCWSLLHPAGASERHEQLVRAPGVSPDVPVVPADYVLAART